MTIAMALTPPVSPTAKLPTRQRACLEQITRRQTNPQRLVRRAQSLGAMKAGAWKAHTGNL